MRLRAIWIGLNPCRLGGDEDIAITAFFADDMDKSKVMSGKVGSWFSSHMYELVSNARRSDLSQHVYLLSKDPQNEPRLAYRR